MRERERERESNLLLPLFLYKACMTYLTLLLVVYYALHTKVRIKFLSSILDNCLGHNLNTYCHWVLVSVPKY